mgnify:CR=1 FL=1
MNILIVDDHMIIRRGLVQILQEFEGQYDIEQAADGVEAMQKLRKAHFDAVLLDVALGERDGFDVLKIDFGKKS